MKRSKRRLPVLVDVYLGPGGTKPARFARPSWQGAAEEGAERARLSARRRDR
jgi:hypothetical protein